MNRPWAHSRYSWIFSKGGLRLCDQESKQAWEIIWLNFIRKMGNGKTRRLRVLIKEQGSHQYRHLHHLVGRAQDVSGDAAQGLLKIPA